MATITKIDRAACRVIDAEALKALEAVAAKLGLSISKSGASFDPSGGLVNVKFTFKTEGSDEANFARYLFAVDNNYGDDQWLTEADYNAEITISNAQYRITGINPNRPKFRIAVTRISDGKVFGFTAGATRIALERAKASR